MNGKPGGVARLLASVLWRCEWFRDALRYVAEEELYAHTMEQVFGDAQPPGGAVWSSGAPTPDITQTMWLPYPTDDRAAWLARQEVAFDLMLIEVLKEMRRQEITPNTIRVMQDKLPPGLGMVYLPPTYDYRYHTIRIRGWNGDQGAFITRVIGCGQGARFNPGYLSPPPTTV